MKIVFNALRSGLGNNGGTKTLLRSAEVLKHLGHDVCVVARVNRYTWHNPFVKILPKVVEGDAIIAASDLDICHEQKNTHYWIRSWGLWNSSEKKLLEKCRSVKMIANSTWLQRHLQKNNIPCDLCYAGYEKQMFDLDVRRDYNKARTIPIVGFLHSERETKRSLLAKKIITEANAIPLPLFHDGSMNSLLYNIYMGTSCWLSTSTLEGFHNPPFEAALFDSHVVVLQSPMCGTQDYAIEETATICHSAGDCISAFKNINYKKNAAMRDLIKTKIKSREENMTTFVNLIRK